MFTFGIWLLYISNIGSRGTFASHILEVFKTLPLVALITSLLVFFCYFIIFRYNWSCSSYIVCCFFPNLEHKRFLCGVKQWESRERFSSSTTFGRILGLQPRDKAAMLGVNTIEILLEKFTWKKSLVPRGETCFCFWPPTWPPWRHVQTSNAAFKRSSLFFFVFDIIILFW